MNRRMSVVRRQATGSGSDGLGIKIGDGKHGHTIISVAKGSAGEDAGLMVGDTITHVNGRSIADKSRGEAIQMLATAGDEFSLAIERAGEVQHLSGGMTQAGEGEGIGITLVTGGAFGDRSAVVSVKKGSLGARAGLRPGDVIASVNGVSMVGRSHADVVAAIKAVSSEAMEIGVDRDNDRVTAKTTSAMVLGLGMVVDLTTEGLIRVVECFITGAADTAGVRVGDIILAIDDHDLIKRKSFRKSVALLRDADVETCTLVVAPRPRLVQVGQINAHANDSKTKYWVVEVTRLATGGGEIEPLGIGISADSAGSHIVSEVVEGGAADRAGMLVGDVMTAINGQTVRAMNQEEVLRVVQTCGVNVTIDIARDASKHPPERRTVRQAPRTVLVTESFSELEI